MGKPARLGLVILAAWAVAMIGASPAPPKPFDDTHLILQTMRNLGVQVTSLRRMPDGSLLISGLNLRGQKRTEKSARPAPAVALRGRMVSGKLDLDRADLIKARLVSSAAPRFRAIPGAKLKPGTRLPAGKIAFKPDLTITDVIFTPAKPKRDEQVLMEVYIENRGDGAASFPAGVPPLRVRVSGGAAIEDIPSGTDAIAPHQRAAVLFYLPPFGTDGTYQVKAEVDPRQRLEESDEANNGWSGDLTIQGALVPRVNFKIEKAWTRPSRITDFTYYWTIVATVKNEGPDATPTYNRIALVGFELPLGRVETGDIGTFDLAAGESYDYAQIYGNAYGAAAGRHQGVLMADPLSQAVETREDDNRLPFSFEIVAESAVADKTDLQIESFRFIPDNPTKEDDIGIEVRIRNAGSYPAVFEEGGEAWRALAVEGPGLPGFFDHVWSSVSIAPSETVVRTYELFGNKKLDPGIYKFQLEINPAHWVTETDYANNLRTITLTVRSKK